MSTENVPLMSVPSIPSAVQFGASKDFHTRTHQQELDGAFLGAERRPWVQNKARRDTRRERETLNALLATPGQMDYTTNCVDKLMAEDVSFRDLASLTNEDLKLFGFTSCEQRKDLLKMFAKMPNQDPSYDYICQGPEAESYNGQIIGNATNHLMSLRSSLAATNYKLQVMPPEDVIVGDKHYASRFALQALNSVKLIADELDKDLQKIKELRGHKLKKNQAVGGEMKKKKFNLVTLAYYTTLALGLSCAWWWWWSKNNTIKTPTVERISI